MKVVLSSKPIGPFGLRARARVWVSREKSRGRGREKRIGCCALDSDESVGQSLHAHGAHGNLGARAESVRTVDGKGGQQERGALQHHHRPLSSAMGNLQNPHPQNPESAEIGEI
jgi:hypothetical protein